MNPPCPYKPKPREAELSSLLKTLIQDLKTPCKENADWPVSKALKALEEAFYLGLESKTTKTLNNATNGGKGKSTPKKNQQKHTEEKFTIN